MEEIDVPQGTQNGDVIVMKRRGLPNTRTGRMGDQRVTVVIEVPRKLTSKQRQLLVELAETENVEVTPARKGFLDKLKDYFADKD